MYVYRVNPELGSQWREILPNFCSPRFERSPNQENQAHYELQREHGRDEIPTGLIPGRKVR
jgi:hypothetical protein